MVPSRKALPKLSSGPFFNGSDLFSCQQLRATRGGLCCLLLFKEDNKVFDLANGCRGSPSNACKISCSVVIRCSWLSSLFCQFL